MPEKTLSLFLRPKLKPKVFNRLNPREKLFFENFSRLNNIPDGSSKDLKVGWCLVHVNKSKIY